MQKVVIGKKIQRVTYTRVVLGRDVRVIRCDARNTYLWRMVVYRYLDGIYLLVEEWSAKSRYIKYLTVVALVEPHKVEVFSKWQNIAWSNFAFPLYPLPKKAFLC